MTSSKSNYPRQIVSPCWTNIVEKLAVLSQQRATGELVFFSKDDQWDLHLIFGHLLYATGMRHRVRRWHRAVMQYCPDFKFNAEHLSEHEPWECQVLYQSIHQRQMSLTQAKSVLSSSINEVFFALAGYSELNSVWFPKKQHPIALLEVKEFLLTAQQMRQQWQERGLEQLCPDQVPVFKQLQSAPENLQEHETPLSLTQLVNGNRTIWDIAAHSRQPVTVVASALQQGINQGILELQTLPDFPLTLVTTGGTFTPRISSAL